MKTLTAAIILNHNLPDWTDRLYTSLKPYERNDYELLVFDNGSKPEGVSQYTTFRSEENLYFGGGFHAGMQVVLEDEKYDSMLFLSNDLVVHPYNFVRALREQLFEYVGGDVADSKEPFENLFRNKYDIVAPCFYNIEPDQQCHWKTMYCWGSQSPREVSFVDFQCPLISRRLIAEVGELDVDLMYGWGLDSYFAIICKQKGWKMAVLDYVNVLHYNSLTVKLGVAGLTIPEYCQKAELGQYNFFSKSNLMKEYHEVRNAGANYTFSK